jgi:proteic killer suppression protein
LEVHLNDKELEKLYTTGKSAKLKLPENIIDKFFATIQKIEAAMTIKDLLADNGLRFEKLKGSANRYSMRLSSKYRLEMEIEWIDDKLTVGKFYLKKISNHYGD